MLTRRRVVSTLAGSLAAAGLAAIAPRPKLFLLIIAEQFRADYLARFSPLFVAGGFRKLMEEGAYLPDCRMNASSFSASGVATIAAGAWPQAHGIVAESWFDVRAGTIASAAQTVSQAGTLADEIALSDGRNRVVAIAADSARAALAVRSVGRKRLKHTILAVDQRETGEPEWVDRFRQAHDPQRLKGAKWQGLLAEVGAPPLRTLTDDPARPNDFPALYRSSPFAQETQFDFLRTAIAQERLGQGPAFDFVVVVLNSMALLGYEVGADSPLMREMALHLDRQIESTIEALKKQVGAGNFGLGFAAAHGVADREVTPIDGAAVAKAVDEALISAYDVGSVKSRWVERYVYPFVYLNQATLRRFGVDARQARRRAGEAALREAAGVAAYYTADGDCSIGGDWRRRFENSFQSPRSGDLMLAYEPNAVERYGEGRGISYGSLYNYDIRTPLVLYGPQFRARTVETPVESADIAPTLARAFGVAAPSAATGRVLGEILALERATPGKDGK